MFKIDLNRKNEFKMNNSFRYFKPDLDLRLEANLGNELFYEINYGEIN
ncbi:hypothetical protein SAMN02910315_02241 [Methanobrevibacter millerae]|uniref:Uncharacterized protein n=1 Tax=Methanobrevibacter millerae TaxID=230361 RepID=A0A1G5XHN4_9EURY|nr:hypothetical protein SAMN02910315_02241 [Methanobrevibacter millerae]